MLQQILMMPSLNGYYLIDVEEIKSWTGAHVRAQEGICPLKSVVELIMVHG